jgi:hypothetical protein
MYPLRVYPSLKCPSQVRLSAYFASLLESVTPHFHSSLCHGLYTGCHGFCCRLPLKKPRIYRACHSVTGPEGYIHPLPHASTATWVLEPGSLQHPILHHSITPSPPSPHLTFVRVQASTPIYTYRHLSTLKTLWHRPASCSR